MSRIKEALLTNKYIDLGFDTTDADYQYEMWLEQQQLEEEYYDSLNNKCEYSGLPSVEFYNNKSK